MGEAVSVGGRMYMETLCSLVFSAQFCYKPKIALKNKIKCNTTQKKIRGRKKVVTTLNLQTRTKMGKERNVG